MKVKCKDCNTLMRFMTERRAKGFDLIPIDKVCSKCGCADGIILNFEGFDPKALKEKQIWVESEEN